MYATPASPPRRRSLPARWARWSPRRRASLIGTVALLLIAAGNVSWWGTNTVRNTVRPSGQPKLELLRRVPHPDGAIEIGHRTQSGTISSEATAWLSYRIPAADHDSCVALLSTFAKTGVQEEFQKAPDPAAAYCKPQGRGFASYCVPRVVCFLAEFPGPAQPDQYTLSTGSGSGG